MVVMAHHSNGLSMALDDTEIRSFLEKIESDHTELTNLIASLRQALAKGHYELTKSLLLTLQMVEARHYATEGVLMQVVGYERADSHRAQHADLLDTLGRINQTLALESWSAISASVVAHIDSSIKHMIEADRGLSQHVENFSGAPERRVDRTPGAD
jgi:hemerythrin-like metal-binding protein